MNSQAIVTINEGLKDYAIAMGSEPEKTTVIRAGVDVERFKAASTYRTLVRDNLKIGKNETMLFYMGWLYEFSGVLEVAEELTNKTNLNNNLRLLIVGKGESFDQLSNLRRDRNAFERVLLFDWMPYDHVLQYLAASDVCILPAHRNDVMKNIVPIKIYEYLAAGKPVIATELPGLLAEFGRENGVIFVNGPAEVIGTVNQLLSGNELTGIGERGRQLVFRNDWSSTVAEFENVLLALAVTQSRRMSLK